MVLISIYFQKSVQQLKSCRTKGKSCTSLVHCPWLLISVTMVFVPECTGFPKLYKFFGKGIYIFKKLYNQRKKLYIFGTLSFPLNVIHNGVGSKMYSFFESCTNSVVLIYIFLKSCRTKEKSCTSLLHYIWLLISFTMVFVPKCTVFSKAVQILSSSYVYFEKLVKLLKSCTSLVHGPWLLISFRMLFVPKCTVFSKAVQILWSLYIYF